MLSGLRLLFQILVVIGAGYGFIVGPTGLGWACLLLFLGMFVYELRNSPVIQAAYGLIREANAERRKHERIIEEGERKRSKGRQAPTRSHPSMWKRIARWMQRPTPRQKVAPSSKKVQADKKAQPSISLAERGRQFRSWLLSRLAWMLSPIRRLRSFRLRGSGPDQCARSQILAVEDPLTRRVLELLQQRSELGLLDSVPTAAKDREETVFAAILQMIARLEAPPQPSADAQAARTSAFVGQVYFKEILKAAAALVALMPDEFATLTLEPAPDMETLGGRAHALVKALVALGERQASALAAKEQALLELQGKEAEAQGALRTLQQQLTDEKAVRQQEAVAAEEALKTLRQGLAEGAERESKLVEDLQTRTEERDQERTAKEELARQLKEGAERVARAERVTDEAKVGLGWSVLELAGANSALAEVYREHEQALAELKAAHAVTVSNLNTQIVQAGYRSKAARLAGVPVELIAVHHRHGATLQVFELASPERYPDAKEKLAQLQQLVRSGGWKAFTKATEWVDYLSEDPASDREVERQRTRGARRKPT